MNSGRIVLFALCLLVGNRIISEASSDESSEAKTRRDTCGGTVHEPPPTPSPSPSSPPSSSQSSAAPSSPSPSSPPPPSSSSPASTVGQCTCAPSTDEQGSTPESSGENSSQGSDTPSSGASTDASSSAHGSTGQGGFHSNCPVIVALRNCSLILTEVEIEIVEELIEEIENSILINITLTDDQKVVLIGYKLKAFAQLHADIWLLIRYQQIVGWGFLFDYEYVAVQIQLELTQTIVTLNASADCSLFEAMRNASEQSGNSLMITATEELIVEITALLNHSGWSYQQQLAAVYVKFQSFFAAHASWQSFFLSIQIQAFGSLESFVDVCLVYQRTTTLAVVVGGDDVESCLLIQTLEAANLNTSYSQNVRNEIGQLLGKLKVYFAANVDIKLRLAYVSAQCHSLLTLDISIRQVIEVLQCGNWGLMKDIIFCSTICTNEGCGNVDNGPGTDATTLPTTIGTIASTGAASSSASTGAPAGDCSTATTTIINSFNVSYLFNTVDLGYNNMSAIQKQGFKTTHDGVKNICFSTNSTAYPSVQSKYDACVSTLRSYSKTNLAQQQVVFAWSIQVWGGTIGQFCGCHS